MQLIANPNPQHMIHDPVEVKSNPSTSFIVGNTESVTLNHLKEDCIIPVFSKDNESTISHYEFINKAYEVTRNLFPDLHVQDPEVRVSHVVKGRIPSAIGKPAKELLDHEKTIYYERCAFIIEIPSVKQFVHGSELALCIGGVRAYNQENLYSRKSLEKFKVFIGFQNKVCTNLCISTDGFSNDIRIGSILDLELQMEQLFSSYNRKEHINMMELMGRFKLSERQFAHLIGKFRMYQHMDKSEQKHVFPLTLNDGQINSIVKDYYGCPDFGRDSNGDITLWNIYNMMTHANKSSYIDNNYERNVNVYELMNNLGVSTHNGIPNFYLS
ncbi:DUF3871 family protein [Gelidibacter maritimus]|uniref:DUF3871 family protein n=1 Tax=Gelidibacter maritimus TaxID=2761487 RepID=A0A7W2R4K8_9FLAO|nr:DUF3871 family protein [Gelidibacter maritimus]MBA6153944.1 DUF3871 family protein [Gelidibacter maritimus]